MIITGEIQHFLSGDLFDSSGKFIFPLQINPQSREDYLLNIAKEKKIIHLGCLDHIPLIDQKIKNNIWLHKNLSEVAEKCIGFDINESGVSYVRETFNVSNVYYEDIVENASRNIINEKWDYIIAGEVLEHISNPVQFLEKIKSNYSGIVDKIVITVPNILCENRLKSAQKGFEIINTDHRYWFTPYTILKVVFDSGITPISIDFKNRMSLSKSQLLRRKFFKILNRKEPVYPFCFFNNLVVVGEL
jgi:hypothetical protein